MWFIARNGNQHGPLTDDQFRSITHQGQLLPGDLIWREGLTDWIPAAQFLSKPAVPQLAAKPSSSPPTEPALLASSKEALGPSVKAQQPPGWLRGSTVFWVLFGLFIISITIAEPNAIPYRLTGALNAALFGAIGGGLGGLVEYLFHRRWGVTAISIGALVGFLLSQSIEQGVQSIGERVYEQVVRPKVDHAMIERRLVNDTTVPIYRTLRDHDPANFRRIVDELLAATQRGNDLEATINAVRKKIIEPLFTANARYLTDDVMLRYAHLVISQMQAFEARQPVLCIYALRGQPLGDIRPYLDQLLIAEEISLLDSAIRADKSSPRPHYSQSDQDKIVEALVAKLAGTHGDGIRLLEPTANVAGQERRVCRIGADFFRGIAALPPQNAAALLRSILAVSSQ